MEVNISDNDAISELAMRVSTAVNYSLNLYLMLQNACGATQDYDVAPNQVEIMARLAHLIHPDDADNGLFATYTELILDQYRLAQQTADGGYLSPSIEHSLSDLASAYIPSEFGDRLAQEEKAVGQLLSTASGKGTVDRNQALFLEISALAQPVGDYFRCGLLAVAVGHLEQHLTLLEACSGGVPSPVLEGRSRVSVLIDSAVARFGSDFDPESHFTEKIDYVAAVRNSVIHREGRIDQRFLDAVSADEVSPDSYGKLLNMEAPSLSNYLSKVFGFAARSALFTLMTFDNGPTFLRALEILTNEVFRVRSDEVATEFISGLPIR